MKNLRRKIKPLAWLMGLSALAALAAYGCLRISQEKFHIAGSITATSHMWKKAVRPNAMLFIVAINSGGVPIAVKRIINPQLPVQYSLDDEDLVLPGPVFSGAINVKVYVNTHGKLGRSERGDLTGIHPGPAYSGDDDVNVVIDNEV